MPVVGGNLTDPAGLETQHLDDRAESEGDTGEVTGHPEAAKPRSGGAVAGGLIGGIFGRGKNSGWKGAAAGAATGAVVGNSRKRRAQADASQQVAAESAQMQAATQAQMDDFKTAFTTCLEAKDYIAKF